MQLSKLVKTAELFTCSTAYLLPLFEKNEYPWQIVAEIKEYIKGILINGMDGYTFLGDGILVAENVTIHPSATVLAPAVIGSGSEIRPGAYVRGNVITGKNCVIGNSTELKNCIFLDGVQAPHYNYVGDSVLGNKAHMGAGAICSNLKSDGRAVVVHGEGEYHTGMRKLGAILADGADVGCGCVLNPGTIVGKNTSVYPLQSLRGVYPAESIVKDGGRIVKRESRI